MGNISTSELLILLSLTSSGVTPVSTCAVSPVFSTVPTLTPPVFTFIAAPGAASAVSSVAMPVAPSPAVTPPTAAPAPVPAGARAPAVVAVAAPPAAVVTGAPPVTAGAPLVMAGAPSPPAVAMRASLPAPALGTPLSVGAVPPVSRPLQAVFAPHRVFPPLLPVFLLVCSSVFP